MPRRVDESEAEKLFTGRRPSKKWNDILDGYWPFFDKGEFTTLESLRSNAYSAAEARGLKVTVRKAEGGALVCCTGKRDR